MMHSSKMNEFFKSGMDIQKELEEFKKGIKILAEIKVVLDQGQQIEPTSLFHSEINHFFSNDLFLDS